MFRIDANVHIQCLRKQSGLTAGSLGALTGAFEFKISKIEPSNKRLKAQHVLR